MIELKPCPFCGGDADEYEGDYGNGIYCMMCGAMVGEPIHLEYRTTKRVSIDEAIEAWNTRAVEVVRCRDCDSWSGPCEMRPGSVDGVCDGWSATGNVVLTREDDFCSYGARREEER